MWQHPSEDHILPHETEDRCAASHRDPALGGPLKDAAGMGVTSRSRHFKVSELNWKCHPQPRNEQRHRTLRKTGRVFVVCFLTFKKLHDGIWVSFCPKTAKTIHESPYQRAECFRRRAVFESDFESGRVDLGKAVFARECHCAFKETSI